MYNDDPWWVQLKTEDPAKGCWYTIDEAIDELVMSSKKPSSFEFVFKSYGNHNHKQKSYKLTHKTYLHSKDVLYSISDVLYTQKSCKVDKMQLKKFF